MKPQKLAFSVGIAGCAGTAIGALLVPRVALTAWLAAFLGFSAIPIGCLALLMMVILVPGSWRPLYAEPLAKGAALLPLAALSFLPVLIRLGWIYPWVDPATAAELPAFKALWLSPFFFTLRAIFYFGLLIGLQRALAALRPERRPPMAAAGLIVYALIGSLLGVDWAESLQPRFHSSIYGLIFLSGQWLAGLGFALLVALPRRKEQPPFAASGPLITALLFWGYIQAMQYIVIWSGDIPAEARWYLVRSADAWQIVTWTIVFGQGVLPFLALLSPRVRESNRALVGIAAVTLAMRLIVAASLVLRPAGLPPIQTVLLLAAAWAAIGGLGGGALLRRNGERGIASAQASLERRRA